MLQRFSGPSHYKYVLLLLLLLFTGRKYQVLGSVNDKLFELGCLMVYMTTHCKSM